MLREYAFQYLVGRLVAVVIPELASGIIFQLNQQALYELPNLAASARLHLPLSAGRRIARHLRPAHSPGLPG